MMQMTNPDISLRPMRREGLTLNLRNINHTNNLRTVNI